MNEFVKHFFSLPQSLRQLGVELIGGILFALAFFSLISFCSPPLPFYNSTCATGLNDPFTFAISAVLFYFGTAWHRFTGHPVEKKRSAGTEYVCPGKAKDSKPQVECRDNPEDKER